MPYPPTSPEGGPSFASEFDILEGIACNVQAINVAAGGESYPINASSFFGLLQSIDCNLCRAVTALGGADCVGGFDGEMGLLMSIACNSRSLVTATSGTQAGNGYEYNTVILWNQINCNFMAVATATGTSAPGGYSGDSVWNLLQSIYCATLQIAHNGFGSVPAAPTGLVATPGDTVVDLAWDSQITADSFNVYRGTSNGGPYTGIATGILVNSYHDTGRTNGVTYYYVVTAVNGVGESAISNQASATPNSALGLFIASLLPFSPDLLIIADSFVGSNGDPVPSAPDSSGNNNPMVQATANRQPLLANGPNGRKSYATQFGSPGAQFLQCPFPGLTSMCGVTVYNQEGTHNVGTNRMVTTLNAIDGTYVGANTPLLNYATANHTNAFIASGGAALASTDDNWHSNASWVSGTNSKMLDEAGNTNTAASGAETADPATYAAIFGDSGVPWYGGIAFHARWATAPSDPDIAAFLSLVNTYYGL